MAARVLPKWCMRRRESVASTQTRSGRSVRTLRTRPPRARTSETTRWAWARGMRAQKSTTGSSITTEPHAESGGGRAAAGAASQPGTRWEASRRKSSHQLSGSPPDWALLPITRRTQRAPAVRRQGAESGSTARRLTRRASSTSTSMSVIGSIVGGSAPLADSTGAPWAHVCCTPRAKASRPRCPPICSRTASLAVTATPAPRGSGRALTTRECSLAPKPATTPTRTACPMVAR
mmetsp:Transcript_14714/g.44145  ORF Transcript_14714/g.44145 Transcript_14714/m.44145 type:complete len:234 (-) Transcript_14714:1482-2183(-)